MAFLIMRMPQHALIKDDDGGSLIYTKRMTRLKSQPNPKLKNKGDVFGFQKLPPVRSKKGKIVDNPGVPYNKNYTLVELGRITTDRKPPTTTRLVVRKTLERGTPGKITHVLVVVDRHGKEHDLEYN